MTLLNVRVWYRICRLELAAVGRHGILVELHDVRDLMYVLKYDKKTPEANCVHKNRSKYKTMDALYRQALLVKRACTENERVQMSMAAQAIFARHPAHSWHLCGRGLVCPKLSCAMLIESTGEEAMRARPSTLICIRLGR